MNIYIYIYIYIYLRKVLRKCHTYIHTYIYIHMPYKYTYIYMNIYKYIYIYKIIYICIYIYIYIYIYYIYIINLRKALRKCHAYNQKKRQCILCLNEKYEIACYKGDNLLNKRTEIFGTYRYRNKYKLKNCDSKD